MVTSNGSVTEKVNVPYGDGHVTTLTLPLGPHDEKFSPASSSENFDDDRLEYLDEEITGPMRHVAAIQEGISRALERNAKYVRWFVLLALLIGYHVYLGFAINHDFRKAETIMVLTIVVWVCAIYYCVIKPFFGDRVYFNYYLPFEAKFDSIWNLFLVRICFYLIVVAAIATFLAFDTRDDRSRLMGLAGMAFFLVFMFLFSTNPARINWRPVAWGFFIQFVLGLTVLRWEWGSKKFHQASDLIVTFLDFTNNGTVFVYGFLADPPNICEMKDGVFAFTSVQVVVYFGAVVALLYYYGIMQVVLKKMAWFMQITLGTTATESLNACACIFLGQSEAPLLIKPYLERMTASEIHAVMTSGFSCIAGSLLAAYIALGAHPTYLLSSTVMSAPGSLACSKIMFPETEKSQLANVEELELPPGEQTNALECISNGAVAAVELVMAIIANLIVFLALLAFLDSVIGYLGELLGYPGWTFELIIGYIFFPLAYIMGVNQDTAETLRVAQLMGTKTALNEFIAYRHLKDMRNLLSPRAQMIATYALCGFSNISSIGIQLGVLGGMAPKRKALLARIAPRALVAGSISCFITACVAGILVQTPLSMQGSGQSESCFSINDYIKHNHSDIEPTVLASTVASTFAAGHFKTEL
uniref:Sodium/nucleoside cotransporter n=1 Tax=Steinernema glaseri TaxID=37863 RepID=A0A1I7ZQT4_9BILA